jgi:hypothetical protein
MRAVLFCLCFFPVVAHPAGLECNGTRLVAGATIMGATVVQGKVCEHGTTQDCPVDILSIKKNLVTFRVGQSLSTVSYFFAVKAFGEGATLTCHEGFNNMTQTANCPSQAYLASALVKEGPQFFTCDHTHATSITLAYSSGPPMAVNVVSATVP